MAQHDGRLKRIRTKIAAQGKTLARPLSEEKVAAFEAAHGVRLPECYRRFVLEVGSAGDGPPSYGLVTLGRVVPTLHAPGRRNWTKLPHLAETFPFRRAWCWGDDDTDDDDFKTAWQRIELGNIFLGDDGCGMYWHLIVTGPERGRVWQFTEEGITPTQPRRDFLRWYEDWLDGVEDWWG